MKKFILAIILSIALTASASAANSDDVYVRKDVFDVHLQNINMNLEKISNRLDKIEVSINELAKAVSVLSERTDRNFEILSTRIDGVNHSLSNRIDGVNSRIDDLRNGLYLWLVVIGTFIAFITLVISWPKVKEIIQNKKQFVSRDELEFIIERIIDAKIHSEKG